MSSGLSNFGQFQQASSPIESKVKKVHSDKMQNEKISSLNKASKHLVSSN